MTDKPGGVIFLRLAHDPRGDNVHPLPRRIDVPSGQDLQDLVAMFKKAEEIIAEVREGNGSTVAFALAAALRALPSEPRRAFRRQLMEAMSFLEEPQ